jgi:hypothetical protein
MLSLIGAVSAALLIFWLGQIILPDNPILVASFALYLGFITWSGIEKLWAKRQTPTDGLDIFPLLKKDALEKWGTKWGNQYEYLNKIVLYDAPIKYPIDAKYILYFDFDTSTPEGKRSEEIFNEINAFQINVILESGFKEVYVNEPAPRFRDEWFLSIVKYSGFNDEYSWMIYKKKEQN